MMLLPRNLLSFLALVCVLCVNNVALGGDPLREMGQDMFCRDEPVMSPCDSKGGRVSALIDDDDNNKNNARCLSVCTTLNQKTSGVVTEYFSQCDCPPAVSNATDAGCDLCCMSPKQRCNKFSSIANAATSDLAVTIYTMKNRDPSFCYDQCPWESSGKSCMLTATMTGICHRSHCELVSDSFEACSGENECKAMGASWCCKEKGKDSARCRVEDSWHKKIKKAIEFNSLALTVNPTVTIALIFPVIIATFVANKAF